MFLCRLVVYYKLVRPHVCILVQNQNLADTNKNKLSVAEHDLIRTLSAL